MDGQVIRMETQSHGLGSTRRMGARALNPVLNRRYRRLGGSWRPKVSRVGGGKDDLYSTQYLISGTNLNAGCELSLLTKSQLGKE